MSPSYIFKRDSYFLEIYTKYIWVKWDAVWFEELGSKSLNVTF